ncbi:MAG: dihydroorotate dehydrogenase electron transfer subunit [Chloroflexi bacterium]|nr:dihydroorotate dehydrogenase electron transfer subunit [Chloroflexota bacterium]
MFNSTERSWNVWPATLPHRARIVDIIPENYRTSSLVLDHHLQAQPGQFIMAWIPGLDEKPFSLAYATPVTLTVARVGPFSSALHALVPGDYLSIRGPFGQGFKPRGRRALLAGGGYGVAPLAYLAEELIKGGSEISVVIGARTAADLLLIERFNRLGIVPQLTTEDGSRGIPGRITAVAAPLLQSGAVDQLYACGPHGMLEALDHLASETGVPAQLSWEAYMRCGVGLCGSCEHRGKLLCLDGPVLPGSCL